jgi:hypothetical protein
MQTKFIILLVAGVALSGCCVSGNGCYTPIPGAPVAWDGLGAAPAENSGQGGEAAENRPRRRVARQREIIVGPLSETPPASQAKSDAKSDPKSRSEDSWARQPAEDRAADAKLARQLKICRDC